MRYLPHTDADRAAMLATIGADAIGDLFADIPAAARLEELPDLPRARGEIEVERFMSRLAARNVAAGSAPFFIGCGAYRHHIPASVDHLIQRSEFLTSYTPYQPEIAQGTLHCLFEFQTQVAMLTGMEVANASMYDGSTAAAEAVLMAQRVTKRKRAVISGGVHPQYRSTIETVSRLAELPVILPPADIDWAEGLAALVDDETSCVVVQYPDVFGGVLDLKPIADGAHAKGALLIVVVTEIVSLGAIVSPGDMGADIVVAEGQSLGNSLSFGGPYVGLFATREKFLRQMPGRLCGQTVDAEGRISYVLTLSAREQHIRREKATSNICTNSGLCALAFSIHLTLLGEAGLRRLATLNHESASDLADQLERVTYVEIVTPHFFNEFTIRVPGDGRAIVDALAERGILGGVPLARLAPHEDSLRNLIVVAATELNTDVDRAAYARALAEVL